MWNDDGEGLFNLDWYGVLFGPVASWQAGESPIPDYQDAYGPVFHGDSSGKINEAEKELMAAQEALGNANSGFTSDGLFWLDPWSAQGQEVSAKLLPVAKDLRLHAEHAIVLLAQARQANPDLNEPDALTAMDLGARRLDLIGMKFQLAQEIADAYARAVAQSARQGAAIGHRPTSSARSAATMAAARICAMPIRRSKPSTRRYGSARTGPTGSTTSPSATIWRLRSGSGAERCSRRECATGDNGKDLPAASPSVFRAGGPATAVPRTRPVFGSSLQIRVRCRISKMDTRLAIIFAASRHAAMQTRFMLNFETRRKLPTLLLIDDDLVSREVTATVLTMSGYPVHTAVDGAGALEMLASRGMRAGRDPDGCADAGPERNRADRGAAHPHQGADFRHQRQQSAG